MLILLQFYDYELYLILSLYLGYSSNAALA